MSDAVDSRAVSLFSCKFLGQKLALARRKRAKKNFQVLSREKKLGNDFLRSGCNQMESRLVFVHGETNPALQADDSQILGQSWQGAHHMLSGGRGCSDGTWGLWHSGHSAGTLTSGFLQKHDHERRSQGLSGCVPPEHAGDVYLKLTVIGDVLIVSFKEL
jgi:hypothetical protein